MAAVFGSALAPFLRQGKDNTDAEYTVVRGKVYVAFVFFLRRGVNKYCYGHESRSTQKNYYSSSQRSVQSVLHLSTAL